MNLLQTLKHKILVGSRTRGVYRSVAEARAAIPAHRKVGYDHKEAENMYPWLLNYTKISDFAVLFYFKELLKPGMRIFDFGGNVGVLYYAFQKRWQLPRGATWTVCDVPAVAAAGRRYAAERESRGLKFTSDFSEAAGADILLTSGTLQCVEEDFGPMLDSLGDDRPQHILINRVPMWDKPEMVSIQDAGPIVYPYRIFERARFLASMKQAGYLVRDHWTCSERTIRIRFRPWIRINGFDGYYLEHGAPGLMEMPGSAGLAYEPAVSL